MKKKQKDIIDYLNSLEKQAVAFRRRSFTYNTFVSEFGTDFSVETPIGTVFIDYEQFEKIKTKGRIKYFGLIKPTLEKPVLIIEHNGNQLFVKSFIDKKGVICFVSVTKNENGEITVVSNHKKSRNNLLNKLKEGSVRCISSNEGLGNLLLCTGSSATEKHSPKYVTISIGIPLTFANVRKKNIKSQIKMEKKENEILKHLNSLEKQAVAFRRRSFTYNTFVSEFGTDFSVETPIGTVFIDYEQFEKIKTKGRDRYFGLIKPTLEKPVLIIEHNGNQLFVKSFIDKKRGIIYFFSVTKNKDGEILVVSNHEKTKSGLKNKLKEGDVRYISSLEGLGSIFPKDKADVRPKEYITISYGIPLTFANIKKKNNKSQIKMEKKLENTVVNADNEKQASKVSGINKKTKKPEKTKVSEKSKDKKDETKTTKTPKYKVEDVATEIRFIKRYTLLHGKVKTKKQILTLLASLQNAILKKQIRKTSPFAKEIDHIQDELISLLSFYGKSEDSVIEIEIDKKSLEKYKSIANSEKVMTAVRLIARYNRLAGKQNVKRKADTLLKSIKNALDKGKIDNYKENIKQIHDSLENYVCGKTEVPEIDEATLNGLKDLIKKKSTKLNNPIHRNKTSAVINSTEFAKLKFTPLLFTGKWAKLIGNPAKPFVMMSYSLPGQGKTSLNIQFAAYLAKEQNKKVLYISDEEKKGYTLQEKIKRFNAVDKNLFLSDRLIDNYKDYDFVIFDSVNSLKLSPEDLKDINSNNPETSFIYVFQTTKDGKFRGSQEFEHDVDVSIELHGGKATTKKTRFGGNGTIKVY